MGKLRQPTDPLLEAVPVSAQAGRLELPTLDAGNRGQGRLEYQEGR